MRDAALSSAHMTTRSSPLYMMPFDHRGSFEHGLFGWTGARSPEQTAQIAAARQIARSYRDWVDTWDTARGQG
jgi:hypothetical protein